MGNRLRPGYLQPFLITILIRAEEIKFSMEFSLHSVHGGVKTIEEIHRRAQRAAELGYDAYAGAEGLP